MKLKYTKETDNTPGTPLHHRWAVRTESGVMIASTKTRREARSYARLLSASLNDLAWEQS